MGSREGPGIGVRGGSNESRKTDHEGNESIVNERAALMKADGIRGRRPAVGGTAGFGDLAEQREAAGGMGEETWRSGARRGRRPAPNSAVGGTPGSETRAEQKRRQAGWGTVAEQRAVGRVLTIGPEMSLPSRGRN